jgi:hypothetical protein
MVLCPLAPPFSPLLIRFLKIHEHLMLPRTYVHISSFTRSTHVSARCLMGVDAWHDSVMLSDKASCNMRCTGYSSESLARWCVTLIASSCSWIGCILHVLGGWPSWCYLASLGWYCSQSRLDLAIGDDWRSNCPRTISDMRLPDVAVLRTWSHSRDDASYSTAISQRGLLLP